NSYLSGANATVLTNSGSLARTGYSFAGWNTQANGTGTSYTAGSTLTMGIANVTLYAVWTNINIGTITISNPINYTVSIVGPPTVYVGVSATFTSTYLGSPHSYQWYLNGSPLSGATTASLSLTPTATTGNFGLNQLMLVITDANGLTYSGTLSITLSN
ncbi:MAG: InlB B-repeat-containing protein, partial [Spirochaetales bacterium]|nr:InlB B-repeat-containing protein [Spirochaetales bacterium]